MKEVKTDILKKLYPDKLHKFHEGLPFLPETMKIE